MLRGWTIGESRAFAPNTYTVWPSTLFLCGALQPASCFLPLIIAPPPLWKKNYGASVFLRETVSRPSADVSLFKGGGGGSLYKK